MGSLLMANLKSQIMESELLADIIVKLLAAAGAVTVVTNVIDDVIDATGVFWMCVLTAIAFTVWDIFKACCCESNGHYLTIFTYWIKVVHRVERLATLGLALVYFMGVAIGNLEEEIKAEIGIFLAYFDFGVLILVEVPLMKMQEEPDDFFAAMVLCTSLIFMACVGGGSWYAMRRLTDERKQELAEMDIFQMKDLSVEIPGAIALSVIMCAVIFVIYRARGFYERRATMDNVKAKYEKYFTSAGISLKVGKAAAETLGQSSE
eukprot:CAMPEP_0204351324 /NCGR_PEP_ID=MMETSP0469-20131031/31028_1 /ASSEMBLY_ACC=CAM_ASM_000384 /TAXON_ID=2969 /ORGANISM="Oxyrrhis marina" /LENGTH=262 /DNA_ID=CAMNT_0051337849 /DNA_START=31 /DNA_END=819 /DNA_ORIENTATION=-